MYGTPSASRPFPASLSTCAPAVGASSSAARLWGAWNCEFIKGAAIVVSALIGMIYVIVLGFIYVLPLFAPSRYGAAWWAHAGGFFYLAANFFFNYFAALTINPGTHDSPAFHRLVQAARAQVPLDLCVADLPIF